MLITQGWILFRQLLVMKYKKYKFYNQKRISNSHYLDLKLNGIKEISFPKRNKKYRSISFIYN